MQRIAQILPPTHTFDPAFFKIERGTRLGVTGHLPSPLLCVTTSTESASPEGLQMSVATKAKLVAGIETDVDPGIVTIPVLSPNFSKKAEGK
jgi:hypothetical protein